MSGLAWIPRFDIDGASIVFTYPIMRPAPGARTEGRMLKSSTGVPGASLRLRKYLLDITLRYTEDEWEKVMDLLAFAQMGYDFRWFPQSFDPEAPTYITTYLEAPHLRDIVKPIRDHAILRMFTLPLTLSRMDQPWDTDYFRIPPE